MANLEKSIFNRVSKSWDIFIASYTGRRLDREEAFISFLASETGVSIEEAEQMYIIYIKF